MMHRQVQITVAIVLPLLIVAGFSFLNPDLITGGDGDDSKSGVHIFRSGKGWGYNITIEGESVIRQPYIPAIPGQQPFKTQKEAESTAKLVLEKISRDRYPAVTIAELDSLGVEMDI